jgi:mRNA interferase RelE/StbE
MYEVIYSRSASQSLRTLQPAKRQQIIEKVNQIAADPYGKHNNVTKLQGREGYRLRVGDWRILYTIENDQLVLRVVDVLPRGSAYKH